MVKLFLSKTENTTKNPSANLTVVSDIELYLSWPFVSKILNLYSFPSIICESTKVSKPIVGNLFSSNSIPFKVETILVLLLEILLKGLY